MQDRCDGIAIEGNCQRADSQWLPAHDACLGTHAVVVGAGQLFEQGDGLGVHGVDRFDAGVGVGEGASSSAASTTWATIIPQ